MLFSELKILPFVSQNVLIDILIYHPIQMFFFESTAMSENNDKKIA